MACSKLNGPAWCWPSHLTDSRSKVTHLSLRDREETGKPKHWLTQHSLRLFVPDVDLMPGWRNLLRAWLSGAEGEFHDAR